MLGRDEMRMLVKTTCVWAGLGLIVLVGGCTSWAKKTPVPTCPGKSSVQEALATLRSRVSQIRPLHVNGQCRMGFVDQKGKEREYNLPMSLFFEPPSNLYLYGQPPVGPRGAVSLGANQEEFWLSVKPDINTLWWGRWDEASQISDLRVSPGVVLEALGMVDFGDPGRWRLENRDGYDVLSEVDVTGTIVKRVSVNPCDYLVYQISYLDESGQPTVVVQLDEYVEVNPTFSLPTRVRIDNYLGEELTDWVKLSIARSSVQEKTFSDAQRVRMFTRPKPRGYDSVIQVTDMGHVLEK